MIAETITSWKVLDFTILAAIFVFNALLLDADLQSILLAILGSISGALILAYYRREHSKQELAFKIFASAIGGLVLGTVLQTYLHIEHPSYVLGLFFTSSMLSLVVLRTLLNFTEQNAVEALKTIVGKWVGVSIESKKRISRNEEDIKQQRRDSNTQTKRVDKLEDKEN